MHHPERVTLTLTLTLNPTDLFSTRHTARWTNYDMHCLVRTNNIKGHLGKTHNYCPPRVAMFGVQRGEGAVQFARSGPEVMCHEQGGPLTHPHCGTRFLLSSVCQYLYAKLVQNATQTLLTFLKHFAAFSTHIRTETKGMVREGQLHRGVEEGSGTTFFLCSSICTCKIGLNCSRMLLPTNSVRNVVTFVYLPYLLGVLRFCVEGRAWVRVGISRAMKASLRLYLQLQAPTTIAANQLV